MLLSAAGSASASTDSASCSTASSGEVGRASGSSANGPSGVVVMSPTLTRAQRPSGRRVGRLRGCPTPLSPAPPGPAPSPARTPAPSGSPAAHHAACSSTRPAAGCCSSGPGTTPIRWARCGRWTWPPGRRRPSPTRTRCSRAGRSSCPPPSGRGASAAARVPAASSATPPTATPPLRPSPLSSRLWLADLVGGGGVRELASAGAVIDPRPDPTGTWVAYAAEGALHVVAADGSQAKVLATAEKEQVLWGVAEFVAAEEMNRFRGYWWAPDGRSLLAARVDNGPVQRWYVADPAHPDRPAAEHRYPVAGSDNAEVTLHVLSLDGARVDVTWDRSAYPYVVRASWSEAGCVLQVMSRDQRRALGARARPGDRRHDGAARAVRRGLGRRRRRRPGPAAGRPSRRHRRPRRHPAARGRRRARHPSRAAGRGSGLGLRGRGPPRGHRRPRPPAALAVDPRHRRRAADRRGRLRHRPPRGRNAGRRRPVGVPAAAGRRRHVAGSPPGRHVVRRDPARGRLADLLPGRRRRARGRGRAAAATTCPARRCRCSWTRTAGRTTARSSTCRSAGARSSGSPTAASPS